MLSTITTAIAKILITPLIFVMSLAGYSMPVEAPATSQNLGATYNPTGGGTYRLGSSIGSTDTSIRLSSFKEPISNTPYTMAIMNTDIAYGTIAPQSSNSEFVSFTGITQNADGSATLTGVTRGLSRSYPYTASSTFRLPHAGQSIFILSDAPQVFSQYAVKSNDEHITGTWTFDSFPITASTTYASETVVGSVQLATSTQIASSTSGSSTARLVIPAVLSTSTAPASGHVVPVTGSDGNLAEGFLPTTISQNMTFSGTTTISGILNLTGSASSTGPIVNVYTASTTYTKPSNLKYIVVEVQGGGGGGAGSTNNSSSGSGGGAGGYAKKLIKASSLTATTSVVVGLGGDAGASGGGAGGNGGTSSFGSFATSTGGIGGVVNEDGGLGGTATGGDINITGSGGGATYDVTDASGQGGSSFFAGGGAGMIASNGVAGTNGGGGSGGNSSGSSGNKTGGAGGNGFVIVTEYFF